MSMNDGGGMMDLALLFFFGMILLVFVGIPLLIWIFRSNDEKKEEGGN